MNKIYTSYNKHNNRGASIIGKIVALILCIMLIIPLTSCGKTDENTGTAGTISTLEDLEGKRIGTLVGSSCIDDSEELAGETGEVFSFNTIADLPQALESNKIDAIVIDGIITIKALKEHSNFQRLEESVRPIQYGFIFSKTSSESDDLRLQMNEFLSKCWADGTIDELWDKWTDLDDSAKEIDYSGITGINGKISVATSSTSGEPSVYISNGELKGVDIELVVRFCEEYGYEPEFTDIDFTGLIAGITTDKYLMGACSVTITEERSESINFSDPYYDGGIDVIVKTADSTNSAGLLESIQEGFSKTLIKESRWKLFARGALNTLLISLCSMVLGTLVGFVVFVICRNGGKIRNKITDACIWFISGMPSVVLLMILFYIVFATVSIGGIAVSIVAFTLIFATGTIGMLRTGLEAIDEGQHEAGIALGYTDFQTFIKIILPQIIKLELQTYESETKELLKATSIVGYIAVQDLTKMGDVVRSATYDAIFPLLIVAIVYFVLEYLLKKVIKAVNYICYEKKNKDNRLIKGLTSNDYGDADQGESTQTNNLTMFKQYFKTDSNVTNKNENTESSADGEQFDAKAQVGEMVQPENRTSSESNQPEKSISYELNQADSNTLSEAKQEIIRFENICKEYDDLEVLKGVNLTIYKGDVVSVIGPSGCGKSTLLRCLNFLDPPTSGTIIADGMEITKKGFDNAVIHAHIGTVFQRWNLFDHWTVIENLMRPQMDLLHISRQEAYDRAIFALTTFSLQDKPLSYPRELSGGQQQRIAILRTLLLNPSIIVLDEPTSALDPCMVGEVQMALSYYAKRGTTMMIVSHDMNFSRKICNRVVYMDEKQVYEEGTPEEIFEHPKRPRTRAFISQARVQTFDITTRKNDILGILSQIDSFCIENRISVTVNNRLKQAFITVCLEILIPNMKEDFLITTVLSYSERLNQVKLIFFYTGDYFDPEDCQQREYWEDAMTNFETYEYKRFDENGYSNWFLAIIKES